MSLKQWVKRQVRKVIPAPAPAPEAMPELRGGGASNHGGNGPHRVEDVIRHYDEFMPEYREVYGDIMQAARPFDIEELLKRELESSQMQDGQRVLDAGCGVCGPAIWFAKHKQITIDAVTISPAQLEAATDAVKAAGLSDRIKVHIGDYHKLEETFPKGTFDRVYFLESLCHAESYRRVLASAFAVLKPGGCIYIKDYLELDLSADPDAQRRADKCLKKAYAEYHFTLIQEKEMLALLKEVGFELEFMENIPFNDEKEDLAVQVNFEQKVGFHWRDELDLRPSYGVEIRARKPAV